MCVCLSTLQQISMNVRLLSVAADWLHLQDSQADASCEPCSVASHTHTDLLYFLLFFLCEQKNQKNSKKDHFMVDNIFFL